MNIQRTFTAFCIVCVQVSLSEKVNNKLLDGCTHETDDHWNVYIGWPYSFRFVPFAVNLGYAAYGQGWEYDQYINDTAECLVQDSGTKVILFNETMRAGKSWMEAFGFTDVIYKLTDISEDSPSNYTLIFKMLKANYCSYKFIIFHKRPGENLPENAKKVDTTEIPPELRSKLTLLCVVKRAEPGLLLTDHIQYNWAKNNISLDKFSKNKLIIYELSFEDSGSYTCSVTYKNLTRFFITYKVCIAHAGTAKTFSLHCPPVVRTSLGVDVTINCSADMGLGKINSQYYHADWRKTTWNGTEEDKCKNERSTTTLTVVQSRYQCTIHSQLQNKCYFYDGSPENYKPPPQVPQERVFVIFIIRNVTETDLGRYTLEYFNLNLVKRKNVTLELEINILMNNQIKVFVIMIALLLLLLMVMIVCILRKDDLKWFWKKYFGAYEIETKKYVAYLAYYYSTDPDKMNETSRKTVETIVDSVHEILHNIGASIYDEAQEDSVQKFKVEDICRAQQECSRIIIILSREYITDHWSVHTAYRALQSMVENGTTLIFITAQGVNETLQNATSDTKLVLRNALKVSETIPWTEKTNPRGRFRRQLEYALPKLRKNRYNRQESTTSQANLIRYSAINNDMLAHSPDPE